MSAHRLKNTIKSNGALRVAYRRAGSLAVRALGLAVPVNHRRILFVSFGGRGYSDSPRALFEAMRDDPFFDGWEMAWAFTDPDSVGDIGCGRLRIGTPAYFRYALSSRVWVTNASVGRGMSFSKADTICVNTWHGSPIKGMGYSMDRNPRFKEHIDIGCCQNDVDRQVFMRLFDVRREDLLRVDLPRNDSLLRYTGGDVARLRGRLGIPEGKRALLYMPTWRDYGLTGGMESLFLPPVDLSRWERELAGEYVLLVRFHYLMDRAMALPDTPYVINVSGYPDLNDLYAVSDVLVSDYSSSYIDFSILGKPMLCLAYDLEEYGAFRGFEIDFGREMPCRIDRTEDELIESIRKLDYAEASARAREFHERFSPYAGHATEAVVAELKRRLSE